MRVRSIAGHPQKVHLVILEKGEEVVSSLLAFAHNEDVRSAQVTAIGAFSEIVLGFFDPQRKRYLEIPVREQVEVVSLAGNFTEENGQQRLHAHVAVAKRDGTAHGGHLMRGIVGPTLEAMVTEVAAHLQRRSDPETGLALISDVILT